MNTNWKIYYKSEEPSSPTFAEYKERDGKKYVCTGKIFTGGLKSEVLVEPNFREQGFHLTKEWHYDLTNPDYQEFENLILTSIKEIQGEYNALAIITDSSLETIGLAIHNFDDIESTDDEQLWIVDEWAEWIDLISLDPAYRWLLSYSSVINEDSFYIYQERVVKCFQDVLNNIDEKYLIRLISMAGSPWGHELSAKCMNDELSSRMLAWI